MKTINDEIEKKLYEVFPEFKSQKKYNYKAGFLVLIFIFLYYYFDNNYILVLIYLIIASILANIYKYFGYKEGFYHGYKTAKGIDIEDENE